MMELIIRGDNAEALMNEITQLGGAISVGRVVMAQQQRLAAQQGAGTAGVMVDDRKPTPEEQAEANRPANEQTGAPADAAPKRGRGRPPKDTPTATQPEAQQPNPQAEADTAPAGDPGERTIEKVAPLGVVKEFGEPVPKNLDELRALIQKVCAAKSPSVTEVIIKKFGDKTSLIPVEKYPEVAQLLHEAMTA